MPFLERDGTKVSYEVVGPDALERAREEAGERAPAVVFLHNIFCDRRVFTYAIALLQSRHRTVAIDLRGHGESPVPRRRYRIKDLVGDVVAILDQERIPQATFVGLSLGAAVAMELALAHPDRVERLVLMGADASAESGATAIRNALFTRLVKLVGMRPFLLRRVAEILFGATFRREGGELYRIFRARLAGLDRRAAALAMSAWSGRRGLLRALRKLRVPALVMVGDEDVACPLESGQRIADAIPGASLVRIPAAGHTMTAERPRETSAALLSFLRTPATAVASPPEGSPTPAGGVVPPVGGAAPA